jgi:uncharacterized protein (DUF2147 family)
MMKRILYIIVPLLVIGLNINLQAQTVTEKKNDSKPAQTDVKAKPAATTSVKASADTTKTKGSTDVKAVPAKQVQPQNTHSRQNASGNTIIELHPNGKKTGKQEDPFKPKVHSQSKKPLIQNGTKLGSANSAPKIMDADGKLMMSMAPDGTITNAEGKKVGMYYGNGEIYTPKGDKWASVDEYGLIRNKDGENIGRISKYGDVVDKTGKVIGYIHKDGTILDASKQKLGSAVGVDMELAALVFFTKYGKK